VEDDMKKQRSGSRDWARIALGLFLLGSAVLDAGPVAAARKEHPRINIAIHNYAQVPETTLEEAEAVATRVLSIARIEARWRQHGESRADSKVPPNSSTLKTTPRFDLLIIPRAMAAYWASRTTSLGLAVIPGEGKRGDRAYVFYHRVEEMAATGEASAGQILGHAMAHEIGHLLLNSTAHSGVGIMQAEWHKGQMRLLRSGWLLFTGMQSRQMRAEILARQVEGEILEAGTTRK
jgi:hypothetical protein